LKRGLLSGQLHWVLFQSIHHPMGWVILIDPSGNGPNISLDQTLLKRTGKGSHIHLDFYSVNQEMIL
jgi:hypothetical protein